MSRAAATLDKYIDDFSILIDSAPYIMLLAIDLHEHFIGEKCMSIALVLILQSPGILRSELIAP